MLLHPTLSQLDQLGLTGMAKAFKELADNPEAKTLDHAEWLGLLLDHEATERQAQRAHQAALRGSKAACATPSFVTARPASRTSTSTRSAASIAG